VGAKEPDEGDDQDMEEGRVVGGIEWVLAIVSVRPFAAAEEEAIHQLEALALVVIEREPKERSGVIEVDEEIAQEDEQRQSDEGDGEEANWAG
jgi:hypothetical protein